LDVLDVVVGGGCVGLCAPAVAVDCVADGLAAAEAVPAGEGEATEAAALRLAVGAGVGVEVAPAPEPAGVSSPPLRVTTAHQLERARTATATAPIEPIRIQRERAAAPLFGV
jgi:hypothetical protein